MATVIWTVPVVMGGSQTHRHRHRWETRGRVHLRAEKTPPLAACSCRRDLLSAACPRWLCFVSGQNAKSQ